MRRNTHESMKAGHSLLLLAVLAALCISTGAQTQNNGSTTGATTGGGSQVAINLDPGDAIGGCIQMPDGSVTCDWIQYIRDIGMKAMKYAAIVVILAFSCCVFFVVKCCDGFGGKEPSHGWCCGKTDPPVVYSHNMVMLAKGGSIAVVVLLLIGPIVVSMGATGLWGSAMDAYGAVFDVIEYAESTAKDIEYDLVTLKNNIAEAQTILSETKQQGNVPGLMGLAQKGLNTVKNGVNKAINGVKNLAGDAADAVTEPLSNLGDMMGGIKGWVDKIKKSQQLVKTIMMVVRIACMGVVLVPVLIGCKAIACGFICHRRSWSTWCCPTCSLWKFATISFIGAGFFSTLHILARGLDQEVALAVQDDPRSVLRGVIQCDLVKFDDAEKLANETIAQGIDVSCTSLLILCAPGSRWNCMGSGVMQTYLKCKDMKEDKCSSAEACDLRASEFYQYPAEIDMLPAFLLTDPCSKGIGSKCTVKECSQTCDSTDIHKNNTKAFVLPVESMKLAEDLLYNKIKPLLGCEALYERLLGPFAPPVHKFATSVGKVKIGLVLEGIFIMVSVAFLLWAYKRFWKVSELAEQKKKLDATSQPVVDPNIAAAGVMAPVVGVPVQPEESIAEKEWVDEYSYDEENQSWEETEEDYYNNYSTNNYY